MSNTLQAYWDRALKDRSIYKHKIYSITEFEKIKEKPGIYAWFVSLSKNNVTDYFKIFKQKKYKVNVKGFLQDKYEGEVKAIYDKKTFVSQNLNFDLGNLVSLAFSPPLYIGISCDLNTRLNDHTREFLKIYHGKVELEEPKELGKTDFDTIIESSHFAQRFGHTVKSISKIELSSIFVKTIELDIECNWSELQKVEKYLNRSFIPLYGRK